MSWRGGAVAMAVTVLSFGTASYGADLAPRDNGVHAYATPPVYRTPPVVIDPGPATDVGGYYGFYGTDIAGVPYGGLYSANVLCLRSVPTPYGYRTVNIC